MKQYFELTAALARNPISTMSACKIANSALKLCKVDNLLMFFRCSAKII